MNRHNGLIACFDVAYGATEAACVLIDTWDAATPVDVQSMSFPGPPSEYEPGALFRRELPLLIAFLNAVTLPIDIVIVDGYVWLSDDGKHGLGAHLFEHLGRSRPVIGVAKTRFRNDTWSTEVFRANSRRPLLVTSSGMPAADAAAGVQRMHGNHRVPTMLKAVDRAARERLKDMP